MKRLFIVFAVALMCCNISCKKDPKPTPVDPPVTADDLCITAIEPSTVAIAFYRITNSPDTTLQVTDGSYKSNIEYSHDGLQWTRFEPNVVVSLANAGDKIYLRGDNPEFLSRYDRENQAIEYTCFNMTGRVAASGNIMQLVEPSGKATEIPGPYYFYRLFDGCDALTSAPELPATTLGDNCYGYMFNSCSSLLSSPELPATEVSPASYACMFRLCTGLTEAGRIHAKKVGMFGCMFMFNGCSSLVTAPIIDAEEVDFQSMSFMFERCSAMTSCPDLKIKKVGKESCAMMFARCTSLLRAPGLPVETLGRECFLDMFYDCSSLASVPSTLPATTLAEKCYRGMFANCSNLTTAPALPATTLAEGCYYCMFAGCSSLTSAPELPATTLVPGCYVGMFQDCSNLSYVKALFNQTDEELNALDEEGNRQYLGSWLLEVSPIGRFVRNAAATYNPESAEIPEGWSVENN